MKTTPTGEHLPPVYLIDVANVDIHGFPGILDHSQSTPNIQPADLIFTRSNSFFGRGIRWAEQSYGESVSWTNHTAGIGLNNNVIEADTKVVSTPFDDWRQGKVGNKWGRVPTFQLWRFQSPTWRFQRFTPFSSARKIVAIYAESQINRPYGYLKLIPHFLDAMISKVTGGNPYLFRRLLFIANYPICSWVWGYAYDQVGLSLGGDPRSQAPDDQLDYVIKNRFDQDLGINGNWKRIM